MCDKRMLALLPFFLVPALPVQARQLDVSEVPAAVIDELRSKHPEAKNIRIEKTLHFRANLYQARFQSGAKQNFVLFDAQGKPFGHEDKIDPLQLPVAVNRKLEKAFGNFSILNSQIIRHPDGRIEYELEINGDGANWELAMSPGGNILTKNQI